MRQGLHHNNLHGHDLNHDRSADHHIHLHHHNDDDDYYLHVLYHDDDDNYDYYLHDVCVRLQRQIC